MDNNDSISIQFVALDVALEKNNDVDALQALNKIIEYLKIKISEGNAFNKEQLIHYLIKRMTLNFKNDNYKDVLNDSDLIAQLGGNINKNKNLFIMKEHAFMETTMMELIKRFEEANKNFNGDQEIKLMLYKIKLFNVKHTFTRTKVRRSTSLPKKQKL